MLVFQRCLLFALLLYIYIISRVNTNIAIADTLSVNQNFPRMLEYGGSTTALSRSSRGSLAHAKGPQILKVRREYHGLVACLSRNLHSDILILCSQIKGPSMLEVREGPQRPFHVLLEEAKLGDPKNRG